MEKTVLYKHIRCTAISMAIGIVVMSIVSMLGAILLVNVTSSEILINGVVLLSASAAGFATGFINARMIKKKGMILGAMSGGVICILMIILKLAFFGSAFDTLAFVKLGLVIVCAICGGIIGVNKCSRNKYARA